MPPEIWILRDPRESWKKCSLAPLRGRPGVRFFTYRLGLELPVGGRLLLDPAAPLLGPGEAGGGLLLLDSSWRRLPKLRACLRGDYLARSLPAFRTAYPRRSETFPDPEQGLASIEALFAAGCASGHPDPGLLLGYRFARRFLELNPDLPGGPFDLPHPPIPGDDTPAC